jgi:hypothetical protein
MSDKPPTITDAISICLAMCQRCLEEVRAIVRTPGPQGPPGPAGRNATDLDLFKDYIDQSVAAMLGTASVASPDGGRTLQLLLGGKVLGEVKTATVLDAGVWKDGTAYSKGDGVTSGGSFWIAQSETASRPGKSDEWRLAVKRGNDGRDYRAEDKRTTEPVRFS